MKNKRVFPATGKNTGHFGFQGMTLNLCSIHDSPLKNRMIDLLKPQPFQFDLHVLWQHFSFYLSISNDDLLQKNVWISIKNCISIVLKYFLEIRRMQNEIESKNPNHTRAMHRKTARKVSPLINSAYVYSINCVISLCDVQGFSQISSSFI